LGEVEENTEELKKYIEIEKNTGDLVLRFNETLCTKKGQYLLLNRLQNPSFHLDIRETEYTNYHPLTNEIYNNNPYSKTSNSIRNCQTIVIYLSQVAHAKLWKG